jgi:hypothetical protein
MNPERNPDVAPAVRDLNDEPKWKDDRDILDGWTSFLVSVPGRTEGTAALYRRLVERLLSDVAKPIAEIDREAIEKHLRRLHVSGRGESVRQGVVVAIRNWRGRRPPSRLHHLAPLIAPDHS